MNELTDQPDDQVVEIARRVSERGKKAPNISVEMVDGVSRLTIGKNSDPDERLRLMAAVHICALDAARRYLSSTSLDGKDSAERAMTKLTRTFTTQMEALKRHRAKASKRCVSSELMLRAAGRRLWAT